MESDHNNGLRLKLAVGQEFLLSFHLLSLVSTWKNPLDANPLRAESPTKKNLFLAFLESLEFLASLEAFGILGIVAFSL